MQKVIAIFAKLKTALTLETRKILLQHESKGKSSDGKGG
jgi:hypothetical protein